MAPAKLDFFTDFLPRGSKAAIPCPCAAQVLRQTPSARWSVLGRRWPDGAFWVGGPVERSGSVARWSVLGRRAPGGAFGSSVVQWSVLGRWAGGEFRVGVPGQN